MDAKQFLAEFGNIPNAPGGVVRLRELVLKLPRMENWFLKTLVTNIRWIFIKEYRQRKVD